MSTPTSPAATQQEIFLQILQMSSSELSDRLIELGLSDEGDNVIQPKAVAGSSAPFETEDEVGCATSARVGCATSARVVGATSARAGMLLGLYNKLCPIIYTMFTCTGHCELISHYCERYSNFSNPHPSQYLETPSTRPVLLPL